MQIELLNIPRLIFFVSRIQEVEHLQLKQFGEKIIIFPKIFQHWNMIHLNFWDPHCASSNPLFTIADVLCPTFLCVQLCLFDFSNGCLLLTIVLYIWERIDWNFFFVFFIMSIIGWLGFLWMSLNFCCSHDLILR